MDAFKLHMPVIGVLWILLVQVNLPSEKGPTVLPCDIRDLTKSNGVEVKELKPGFAIRRPLGFLYIYISITLNQNIVYRTPYNPFKGTLLW